MKPDWKDAPEWANYLACDEDNRWWWYEEKPLKSEVLREFIHTGHTKFMKSSECNDNWRETLEKRP